MSQLFHGRETVKGLVDRFGEHIDTYKSASFNETQVRRDFIDPLFGVLGWDVDNREGLAEAYRHVIHEDAIKIGGSTACRVASGFLWLTVR